MNESEITNLALKAIEIKEIIKKQEKWKQRYFIRAIITKYIFESSPISKSDLESLLREMLE